MGELNATVQVIVQSIAGLVLFGPETLSTSTTVDELKVLVKESIGPDGAAARVKLLQDDGTELLAGRTLAAQMSCSNVVLTAVVQRSILSPEVRDKYLCEIRRRGSARLYWYIFEESAEDARGDHDLALDVVMMDSSHCVADELWSDRDFVFAAVEADPMAMMYVDAALKADRHLVTLAVHRNGSLLQYAHQDLRADRELALAAARSDRTALLSVDPRFLGDRAFAVAVLENDGMALALMDATLRADKVVVTTAVRNKGQALQYADESLKADRTVVQEAVGQNPAAIRFACLAPEQEGRQDSGSQSRRRQCCCSTM
eukprot:TRINITY_DN55085_c0_g1_i1.p1 TRINITY_DN55085_c0_g1~~TRINITY_DN55085_c0_g1_i1.p1  ORF type:complete len:316 (-),score=58.50 TRINITY_DN55085_c0_g1_i1:283-1230(-)